MSYDELEYELLHNKMNYLGSKLQHSFLALIASFQRVTDGVFLKNCTIWLIFFLLNVFIALKGSHFYLYPANTQISPRASAKSDQCLKNPHEESEEP